MSNTNKSLFAEAVQELKKASRLRCIIAILISAALGIFTVIEGQKSILTASVMKWTAYFCIAFISMSLFFIYIKSPLKSIFWFLSFFLIVLVPYTCHKYALDYYTYENDNTNPGSEHPLSLWLVIWTAPILIYALGSLLGKAVAALKEKDNTIGKTIYTLGLMLTPQLTVKTEKRKARSVKVLRIVGIVMIVIMTIVFTLTLFLYARYRDMDFEAILFTVKYANGGNSTEVYYAAAKYLICMSAVGFLIYGMYSRTARCSSVTFRSIDRNAEYTLEYKKKHRVFHTAIIVLALIASFASLAIETNFVHYVKMNLHKSTIYEDYYVFPDNKVISFPEKKRNLIYIYLESMENTFTTTDRGGTQYTDYIPELVDLAEENISFSNNSGLGGPSVFFPSITYTMGSTVGQTGGVALKTIANDDANEMGKYSEFLPSLRRIEDILHEEGYEQLYIRGEDTVFAGYNSYVGRYDDSNIFDMKTAKDQGYVSIENLNNSWGWGFNDKILFEQSKRLISELAKSDKPFFATLYTVDTHSIEGGSRCELCDDSIENDYLAATRCSSRQVSDFIEWIKKQDFYENTTIIMIGDHLGIHGDNTGIEISDSYKRTTYNCIINAAKEPVKEKNRIFCSLDMFPTTLSAIGCEIKGDRLGLGTDLFSKTPTLCEKLGTDKYIDQLERNSDFYNREFWNKE